MTMIELGEISPGSEPEPLDRPIRRRDVRRIGVAVAVLLCLLTVTGSARPEPRSLPTLWSVPFGGDQFTLTADAVFLLEPRAGHSLSRYDAATGKLRWSTRLDQFAGWLTTETRGLVLLPGVRSYVDQIIPMTDTLAIDAATGAERWRQPGDVMLPGNDTVLLAQWDSENPRLTGLRLVRAADGRVLWTIASNPPVAGWTTLGAAPTRPDRLVTVTDQGRMEVRRYGDGVLIASGTVPWLIPAPNTEDAAYVFGSAGRLFVVRTVNGRQDIYAYQPDTLAQLWHVRADAGFGMFDCGPVLCVNARYTGVDGRDPGTGRLVWHSEGWDWAWPLRDGRLLAQGRDNGRSSVIDPATGRVLVDLGPARNVLEIEPGRLLIIRLAQTAPYGSKIIELDHNGEQFLRGVLGSVADQGCQTAGGRMACAVAGGQLTVKDVG
ncbi:MAG TPA: PQQ-binding-like beta-propeller repeat protein [Actinoplanes sp.]|nr:PQQ-binding-like beta-propeller repeat protein [Actinoplanes sp.]